MASRLTSKKVLLFFVSVASICLLLTELFNVDLLYMYAELRPALVSFSDALTDDALHFVYSAAIIDDEIKNGNTSSWAQVYNYSALNEYKNIIIVLTVNIDLKKDYTKKDSNGASSLSKRVTINHLNYCKNNGYIYVQVTSYPPGFPPDFYQSKDRTGGKLGRIFALKYLFKSFNDISKRLDFIFYIDFDVIFLDFAIQVEHLYNKSKNIAIDGSNITSNNWDIILNFDACCINSGVVLMKNTPLSVGFVNDWAYSFVSGRYVHGFKDQVMMIVLLNGFDIYNTTNTYTANNYAEAFYRKNGDFEGKDWSWCLPVEANNNDMENAIYWNKLFIGKHSMYHRHVIIMPQYFWSIYPPLTAVDLKNNILTLHFAGKTIKTDYIDTVLYYYRYLKLQ